MSKERSSIPGVREVYAGSYSVGLCWGSGRFVEILSTRKISIS